ncbi:hypothetical protein HanXRQr2_Chr11g0511831 [Helianthus annuus]|uniref:Uncharacterized protein n=1 Tax=Helianthus annuus TaxID=4232 RepID=A0A9K3HSN9_HELAN|nr:hypothetical protein HanXRQr2_Chr11g0511831 [Helianthus annuus]KAJ0519022.1 hypothetical protein HanHA89_Chr11g0443941 [Helianthus annuus]KAJ0690827.1 hypothetical protein HanOQP8_Chr11g0422131 [Helianthus annuus]
MGELTCLMHSLSDNHVSFDKLRVFVIQYQMSDELSLFEACFIVMFVVLDWLSTVWGVVWIVFCRETMYMLLGIQPTHGGAFFRESKLVKEGIGIISTRKL